MSISAKIYLFTVIIFLFCVTGVNAQEKDPVSGDWYGNVVNRNLGINIPVVFHISRDEKGSFTATMDSPDQGMFGMAADRVTFADSKLEAEWLRLKGKYTGLLKDGKFSGTWKQGAGETHLTISREKPEPAKRPQLPRKPYPYLEEQVKFKGLNGDHNLAGTLTIPEGKGPFPAVALISGSGPQDRDETLLGHKPFLVLADHLTKNGVAVLRYDDRGTAESEGNFASATSLDFADDAEAAMIFLQGRNEVDSKKIGLIGHSEGGLIAPIVAARNPEVSFIVLLAGPGLKGNEILLLQSALISKAAGVFPKIIELNRKVSEGVYQEIVAEADDEKARENISKRVAELVADQPAFFQQQYQKAFEGQNLNQLLSPWFRFFLDYDPTPALTKVKCPVLAINGEKDLQVPPDENLEAIEKALTEGGNNSFTLKKLDNLNHLFQNCKTGAITEYSKIEETFSPEALNLISSWIGQQTNK